MRKLLVAIAVAVTLFLVAPVWATEVEVNFVPMNSVEGLDLAEGSAGTIWDKWTYLEEGEVTWDALLEIIWKGVYKEDYGYAISPLFVIPKAGTLLGAKLNVGLDGMIHLGGWVVSGSGSKSGSVPGFNSEYIYKYTDEYGPDWYRWTVEGEGEYSTGLVNMLGENFASLWYEYDYGTGEGKFYPDKMKTSWDLARDFNISSYYVAVSKPVGCFRAGLGARFASYSVKDYQHVHGGYHEQYTYSDEDYSYSDVWHNEWDLTATPAVNFAGVGPMLSLSFARPVSGKFSVSAGVNGGLVFGPAIKEGNFADTDKGFQSYTEKYEDWLSYEGREDWEIVGKVPFEVSYTTSIPVVEANFGINYQITPNISAGLYYQKAWWKNVPQPPRFHYDGYNGGYWSYGEKDDVAVGGFGLSVVFKL